MRGKNLNKKQKNILIGSLLAVVVIVLIAVAYAAFSASLNINGTASVSSTWDIKITSVTAKNIVGSASDNTDVTTFSNLSANVAANLVSPGDSISYDIVVTNNGSVDAKLDTITGPTSNNAAITMSKSGLTAGDTISAGSTKTLTVTIGYSSSETSQSVSTTAASTISLSFSSSETSQPASTTAQSTISLSFSQYIAPSVSYVYAWNESLLYYSGANQSNSSAISPSYSSFAAMNAVQHEGAIRNYGLKYGIENGKITEAYVCFLSNSEEVCLQGSTDGSMYAANKAAMEAFFTGSNGSCGTCDSSYCTCCGDELSANAYSNGNVSVSDGSSDCVGYGGGAYCAGL